MDVLLMLIVVPLSVVAAYALQIRDMTHVPRSSPGWRTTPTAIARELAPSEQRFVEGAMNMVMVAPKVPAMGWLDRTNQFDLEFDRIERAYQFDLANSAWKKDSAYERQREDFINNIRPRLNEMRRG